MRRVCQHSCHENIVVSLPLLFQLESRCTRRPCHNKHDSVIIVFGDSPCFTNGLTLILVTSRTQDANDQCFGQNARGMYLANSMGLFLQKTNITRDYLEDLVDNRSFWPADVWSLYRSTLPELRTGDATAIACLNPTRYIVRNAPPIFA